MSLITLKTVILRQFPLKNAFFRFMLKLASKSPMLKCSHAYMWVQSSVCTGVMCATKINTLTSIYMQAANSD